MPRRVCLSIGVATVLPLPGKQMTFGYLDGAGPAARAIGQWALQSGFGEDNVRILTDEKKNEKVTETRLEEAVDHLLPEGGEPVEHMVLSFCGHGLTDANAMAISWLLSDSIQRQYRVFANALYPQLLRRGIERLTVISDACREAPRNLDLMRLEPRRIVVSHGELVPSPKLDRLASCQDGQLGYMVKGSNAMQPGKCVFSGVIADVLWGREPDAIRDGKIGVHSLVEFADRRTVERAKQYRLELNPDVSMHYQDAVLYDATNPPQGEPPLQPWPAVVDATSLGSDARATMKRRAQSVIRRIKRGALPARKSGGRRAEKADDARRRVRPSVTRDHAVDGEARNATDSMQEATTAAAVKRVRERIYQLQAEAGALENKGAAERLRRSVSRLKIDTAAPPDLVVMGEGATLWSESSIVRGQATRARTNYEIGGRSGRPMIVGSAEGKFMPVVPYIGAHVVVRLDPEGHHAVLYGSDDFPGALPASLHWIAKFVAGDIKVSAVQEIAAALRHAKHADPMLGVVCAYLYHGMADVDSIRRMAYFYVAHGQPVPFDIVLLGDMPVTRGRGGELTVEVPAVGKRKLCEGETLPDDVLRATEQTVGHVGGYCPWLGLGWDHIGLVRPEARALVEGLQE